jgi:hypothetical protein
MNYYEGLCYQFVLIEAPTGHFPSFTPGFKLLGNARGNGAVELNLPHAAIGDVIESFSAQKQILTNEDNENARQGRASA